MQQEKKSEEKHHKQINVMRNSVDPILCDILQEGLMTYFKGESITNAMLRIRGTLGNDNYSLLIDEQMIIGWDSILRGKFTKQWKIQQQAYITRRRLKNPALHAMLVFGFQPHTLNSYL
jgi:hypothetical protein